MVLYSSPSNLIQIPTIWPGVYIETIPEGRIRERQNLDPKEQLLEKKVPRCTSRPILGHNSFCLLKDKTTLVTGQRGWVMDGGRKSGAGRPRRVCTPGKSGAWLDCE